MESIINIEGIGYSQIISFLKGFSQHIGDKENPVMLTYILELTKLNTPEIELRDPTLT